MTYDNNYVPRNEWEFIIWGWDFWEWTPAEIDDLEELVAREPTACCLP